MIDYPQHRSEIDVHDLDNYLSFLYLYYIFESTYLKLKIFL